MSFRRIVTSTLDRAGIAIDGDQPWDIQVLRRRFFRRAARGNVGLGDAYVDNDWDVKSLDALFQRIISAGNGLVDREIHLPKLDDPVNAATGAFFCR